MAADTAKLEQQVRIWLEWLGSTSTERRVEARVSLKRAPRRVVEPALLQALSAVGPVRLEMLRVCNDLGLADRWIRRLFRPGLAGQLRALNALAKVSDPRTVAPLVRYWARSPRGSARAAEILGAIGAPSTLDLAWEHARKNPAVREKLSGLIRILGPACVSQLAGRLGTGIGDERQWVLSVTDCCVDASSIGRLAEGFGDRGIQSHLVRRLGSMPGEESLLELIRLVRFAPDWDLRLQAVRVLLRRQEPQALAFLGQLVNDREWFGQLSRRLGHENPPPAATWSWRGAYELLISACSREAGTSSQ